MILVLDTPEKFRAVWEALNQFVDNQDEKDDGTVPPEAIAAEQMIAEFDAAVAGLSETK